MNVESLNEVVLLLTINRKYNFLPRSRLLGGRSTENPSTKHFPRRADDVFRTGKLLSVVCQDLEFTFSFITKFTWPVSPFSLRD